MMQLVQVRAVELVIAEAFMPRRVVGHMLR